ncbi:hypothetical protein COLO4_37506 [Corchorus olitorius]|uniref:Uncharacterized protein n=1 Tax=Corchorus olitorius TaxID=93759 RepID=A0A1R3G117_9ROSI|nr:hypothetical protein COLO4_37506 [Corchorus olitorius]
MSPLSLTLSTPTPLPTSLGHAKTVKFGEGSKHMFPVGKVPADQM